MEYDLSATISTELKSPAGPSGASKFEREEDVFSFVPTRHIRTSLSLRLQVYQAGAGGCRDTCSPPPPLPFSTNGERHATEDDRCSRRPDPSFFTSSIAVSYVIP
jgi:hypothetical protein